MLLLIQTERTAIATGVAKSAYEITKRCHQEQKILDYGAGKLRNSKYLKEKGYPVSILDTQFQIQHLKEDLSLYEHVYTVETYQPEEIYDIVLCSFVLNVIPNPEERKEILEKIYQSLKKEGMLFLEVRKKNGIIKNKYREPYNDGYVIGKNKIKTFQKPFEKGEVQELLRNAHFDVEKIQSLSDSIVAIAIKR
jgi:chemotaxis methyl-accepting protein methylase